MNDDMIYARDLKAGHKLQIRETVWTVDYAVIDERDDEIIRVGVTDHATGRSFERTMMTCRLLRLHVAA